jgi:hypothetical protein
MTTPSSRTFPTAGLSPIDVYNQQVRPSAYFEHVVSDDGTERHNVELVSTATMASAGNYVNLNVVTTTAGTAAAWVSSIYAKVIQGSTKNVNGYLCAAEFELVNSAANESANFVLVLNSNNSGANPSGQRAFIAVRDYGTSDCDALFWFGQEIEDDVGTKSATALFSTNVATVATHHLRIVVGGTPYFIMLTNTAAT